MKYNGLLPPDESLNRTHITMHVVLDYINLGNYSLGVYDDTFATGNTPMCGLRYESANYMNVCTEPRKYFFKLIGR